MLTLPNICRLKGIFLIGNFLITLFISLFILLFGSTLSFAASVTYNATPALNIPDNGCPTYSTITLPVTDNFILSDVNIGVNINHTYQSDVRIRLTSPQGSTIFLSDGSGNGSDNFDIMFDDAAASSITALNATHNTSTPYYENLFRPTNALSAFNGQNAQGNWIVGVCDKASADIGSVSRVQLVLTGSDPYPSDAGVAVCRSAANQSFMPIQHQVSWTHNEPIGTLNPTIWSTKVASAQALLPAAGLTYVQAEAFATDYVVKQAATANAQAAWAASDYLTYTFTTSGSVESSDFFDVLSYGLYSIRTFGQRITVLVSESATFATATEILSNHLVSPPTVAGHIQINIPVQKRIYVKPSTTYYVRVLFHNLPDSVAGAHWDDFAIGFANCADYGDLDASYGAARHKMPPNDGLRLGAQAPDAEDGTLPALNASGDDTNGTDDEDGITLPIFTQGQAATITAAVAGAGGYLQGWMDWNGNGVFDAAEQVATNLQDNGAGDTNSAAGTITFNVNVPANATTTPTYARFRWSSTTGLNSTVVANNGEIEDYRLTITASSCTPLLASDAYSDEFVQWMHNANTPVGAPANNLKAYIRQPIYAASASDEGFNNLTAAVPNTESHIQTTSIPAAWDTSRYISYSFTTSAFLGSATLYGIGLGVHGDARPTYDKRSGAYRLKVLVDTDPNFGSPTNLINGIRIDDTQPNLDASVSWPAQDLGSSRYYFNHYQATQAELLAPNTTYYVRVYPYSATRSGYDVAYGSNDIIYDDFTLKLKSCAYDLGDAPASYGSPNHLVTSTTYLGANAPDGQDAFAGALNGMNDDTTGIDDEDGIILPTFIQGQVATITATVAGAGGYLQGWMDWNGDGDFADSGEQVATNIQDNLVGDSNNTAGTIAFNVTVPANAVTTLTYARFRWSSTLGLNSTAAASNGEVEDYAITIATPVIVNCPPEAAGSGSGYASSGTGLYKNNIFWLDWSCGGVTQFNPGTIVNKSWILTNGLQITANLSNITATLAPYNTGDWGGDLLDDLYGGLNPIGLSNKVFGEDPTYDISFSASLNGVSLPTDVVIANAEDTGEMGEPMVVTTDGSPFQPIETTGNAIVQFSNGARTVTTDSPGISSGDTLLLLTENMTKLNVNMSAGGVQALAYGFFVPFDFGDAPSGYPLTDGHYLNPSASSGSQPTNQTQYTSLTMATLTFGEQFYLGSLMTDAENTSQVSMAANGDDNMGTDDEDGINLPTLTRGQTATINATVNGAGGYLQGWMDWNGDGDFADSGEQVATNLQDNGAGDTNNAVGTIAFTVNVPATAVTTPTYARFRWSSTSGLNSTAAASDGEVEDYAMTISPSGPPAPPPNITIGSSRMCGAIGSDKGSNIVNECPNGKVVVGVRHTDRAVGAPNSADGMTVDIDLLCASVNT
ncbi:MAG: CshA/CshB family fibrillar adhesin-related protein, partial [Thiofilum sp.]